MLGWWYLSGIYFTVVSLVSCSSPMLPHSATEMTLLLFLHVFGWVFGSLLISTLAAWLVDTKARYVAKIFGAAQSFAFVGICRSDSGGTKNGG